LGVGLAVTWCLEIEETKENYWKLAVMLVEVKEIAALKIVVKILQLARTVVDPVLDKLN
jgi:hypothetical protein